VIWELPFESKPKLATYTKIKNVLDVEPYVLLNLSRRGRSLLAQFRCGILPLMIETGRYRNIPSDKQICPVCDMRELEDESHIMFRCKAYQSLRSTFCDQLADKIDNLNDLNDPYYKLNVYCAQIPRTLAKYICRAYDKRKSLLLVA
jgi:hypothetical protein